MIIEIFSLCDAATEQFGKLNILGTFDVIWSPTVPVIYPFCAIALRLRFTRIEEGDHTIRLSIIDQDGKSVIPPLEGNLSIDFANNTATSVSTNMVLNMQGLKLEKFGEYSIDLAIDSRHEASLPIYVCTRNQ